MKLTSFRRGTSDVGRTRVRDVIWRGLPPVWEEKRRVEAGADAGGNVVVVVVVGERWVWVWVDDDAAERRDDDDVEKRADGGRRKRNSGLTREYESAGRENKTTSKARPAKLSRRRGVMGGGVDNVRPTE